MQGGGQGGWHEGWFEDEYECHSAATRGEGDERTRGVLCG